MTKLLNGWKRLWIVISLVLLVPSGFVAFSLQNRSPRSVEDLSILREFNKDLVIRVGIDQIGNVEFPNNMAKEAIEKIIESNIDKSKEQIPVIAKRFMEERNETEAKSAREENNRVRSENSLIFLYTAMGWLTTVFVIYGFGWSIGWVYRGFRGV